MSKKRTYNGFNEKLINLINKNKKISINVDSPSNLVLYRTKPSKGRIKCIACITKDDKIKCHEGLFKVNPHNPSVYLPIFFEKDFKHDEIDKNDITKLYGIICSYLEL